jgi:hypothetical protein
MKNQLIEIVSRFGGLPVVSYIVNINHISYMKYNPYNECMHVQVGTQHIVACDIQAGKYNELSEKVGHVIWTNRDHHH